MKSVIQRVSKAHVSVDGKIISSINLGCLILLGIEKTDNEATAEKLADKISRYRIFSDANGKMNLSLQQVEGEALVVSQFTLVADTGRGNRPGFSKGASPAHGKAMYEVFHKALAKCNVKVKTGQFGANMEVSLINLGPVTFCIDS